MIKLSEKELGTVKNILANHIPDSTVSVFGSRINGDVKKYSDLDLAIMNKKPLPVLTIAKLREAFSQSILPFKVDLVEMSTISESFRIIIREKHEIIHPS